MEHKIRPNRVLIFIGSVSLAHVCRSLGIAQWLLKLGYEVHIASTGEFLDLFNKPTSALTECTHHIVKGFSSKDFLMGLNTSNPQYDLNLLKEHCQEDENLIERIKPSLIFSDFHITANMVAKSHAIPCVNICNAYWSPSFSSPKLMPHSSIEEMLGTQITSQLYKIVGPYYFNRFLKPYNELANALIDKSFSTLNELYTYGDFRFYCDYETFFPDVQSSSTSSDFFGGLIQEAAFDKTPTWYSEYKNSKRRVLILMGSSGLRLDLEQLNAQLFKSSNFTFAIATLSDKFSGKLSENVYAEKYLPAEKLIEASDVVVCNGGSPMGYLCLERKMPFISVLTNLDQHLFSNRIKSFGACDTIRQSRFSAKNLKEKLESEFESHKIRSNSQITQERLSGLSKFDSFNHWMKHTILAA